MVSGHFIAPTLAANRPFPYASDSTEFFVYSRSLKKLYLFVFVRFLFTHFFRAETRAHPFLRGDMLFLRML